MSYDQEHVEFDDYGIVAIKCMCCGEPVVVRSYIEVPHRSLPDKVVQVMALKKLPNQCEIKVQLSDGSVSFLPHCTNCRDTNTLDTTGATTLMHRGWEMELEHSGKDRNAIKELMINAKTKSITGKASAEV